MLRFFAAALAAAAFLTLPAEAAVAAKTERGVRVWRAAIPSAPAAPALKGSAATAPCLDRPIIIVDRRWPARRLRTHGFWSGDSLDRERRLPFTTTGFYADRIAAGD